MGVKITDCGGSGRLPACIAGCYGSRQVVREVVAGVVPGTLVFGFFLAPDEFPHGRVFADFGFEGGQREWVQLLDAGDGDMLKGILAAFF